MYIRGSLLHSDPPGPPHVHTGVTTPLRPSRAASCTYGGHYSTQTLQGRRMYIRGSLLHSDPPGPPHVHTGVTTPLRPSRAASCTGATLNSLQWDQSSSGWDHSHAPSPQRCRTPVPVRPAKASGQWPNSGQQNLLDTTEASLSWKSAECPWHGAVTRPTTTGLPSWSPTLSHDLGIGKSLVPSHHLAMKNWRRLTQDRWVLDVASGYRLELWSIYPNRDTQATDYMPRASDKAHGGGNLHTTGQGCSYPSQKSVPKKGQRLLLHDVSGPQDINLRNLTSSSGHLTTRGIKYTSS